VGPLVLLKSATLSLANRDLQDPGMMMQSEPIGRDEELSTLFGFLEGLERLPGVVILEGDAGAGKTTLFESGCSTAAELGYRGLVCRPSESERALSFAALRDLLEPVFDELADDLRPPARRALAVALLREGPGRSPSPEGVASALLHLIRVLAVRGALLIGIDDAHWLDVESERVLIYVLRRLRDEPVGVLVSTRSRRADGLVSELVRSFQGQRLFRLPVGPLSLGAIHRVIRDRLGITLARPVLQRLYDTAGGNPFFALEIGRALGPDPSGRLDEPLPVPPTLEDIVEGRLAALSEPARGLLSVVAAMPRPTWRAVRAFLGSTEADRCLSEAERADVLRVESERIRFAHPLLAAHAYQQLTTAERKTLHARLAETSSDLEERARHLAVATEGPDGSVARTLEAAGRDASSRGAPAAAAELLEMAARLTPEELGEQRPWRQLEAARARFVSGDSEAARSILSDLVEEMSPGRLRSEAMATLGRISYYTDDHPAARAFYEGALAEPGVPRSVACEAHDGLVWLLSREDVVGAMRHARDAVRLAEQLGDDRALAEALATRGMAESLLGRKGALDLIARGVGMARGLDYPRVVQHPELAEAVALAWSDDWQVS
jgi:tetratricopeptide (TPR) repeat protein